MFKEKSSGNDSCLVKELVASRVAKSFDNNFPESVLHQKVEDNVHLFSKVRSSFLKIANDVPIKFVSSFCHESLLVKVNSIVSFDKAA